MREGRWVRSRQQAGARPGVLEREAGLDLVRGQATHWSAGKQGPLLILDLRLFALLYFILLVADQYHWT